MNQVLSAFLSLRSLGSAVVKSFELYNCRNTFWQMNHISGRLGASHLHNSSSVSPSQEEHSLQRKLDRMYTSCGTWSNFYKHFLMKSLLFGFVDDAGDDDDDNNNNNNNNSNTYMTVIICYFFSPDTPSSQTSHSLLLLLLLIRLSDI
jgi:hypothetical protein